MLEVELSFAINGDNGRGAQWYANREHEQILIGSYPKCVKVSRRVADCPAVSFRFVHLHNTTNKYPKVKQLGAAIN